MIFENVLIRDFFDSKIYDTLKHKIEKRFIPNCVSLGEINLLTLILKLFNVITNKYFPI